MNPPQRGQRWGSLGTSIRCLTQLYPQRGQLRKNTVWKYPAAITRTAAAQPFPAPPAGAEPGGARRSDRRSTSGHSSSCHPSPTSDMILHFIIPLFPRPRQARRAAPGGKSFPKRSVSFRSFTLQTNETLFFGRNHQAFCVSLHPRRIIPAPLGILFQGSNASRFRRFGKEMLYYQKFTMALSNCCLK